MKTRTIQELYDSFYLEAAHRARQKGDAVPTEVEIFEILYKELKASVIRGDEPPEAMAELAEVNSFHIREVEKDKRKEEVDEALRHGYVIDFDLIK
ncbi:hypothetical protein BH09PAT1_BH09PAT1_6520 [soil metagenome]